MEELSKNIIYIFFFIIMLSSIVSWLTFYFFSVKKFERSFVNDGIHTPTWDFCTIRVMWYATILVFQTQRLNDNNYPFVPVSDTRKLASSTDTILARWLWVSAFLLIIVGFVLP